MIHINGTLLRNAFKNGSNATIGSSIGSSSLGSSIGSTGIGEACPLFSQLTCEEDSIEMLQTIFYACAIFISSIVGALSVLLCILVLQIKRMSRLVYSLRMDSGAGIEVRNSLLAAPELRSSFQTKANKSTKKSAKFTDPVDTACTTARDVDEEDL